jgi:hypothetical protein
MPTPAITQVKIALAALLGEACASEIIVDRAASEAIDSAELPAVIVNCGDQIFDRVDRSTTQHTVLFDLEIYDAPTVENTILVEQNNTVAAIINCIAEDISLGGRLQSLDAQVAPSANNNAADIGAITLTIVAVFLTPSNNFNMILGQSGIFS